MSEHKWDADGERCLNCGGKDWMGGPCSGPIPAPADPGGVDEAKNAADEAYPPLHPAWAGETNEAYRSGYEAAQARAEKHEALYRGKARQVTRFCQRLAEAEAVIAEMERALEAFRFSGSSLNLEDVKNLRSVQRALKSYRENSK